MNSNMPDQENFTRYAVIDEQQQGIALGTFEHPAGWLAESRIYWNYQNTALPSVFYARVVDPQNTAMLEFLPLECFSWTQPETGMSGRGQMVGGVVNLPPMPGIDALVHLIIPKYRGNRQDLRIVAANAEPTEVNPPPNVPPQNVFAHKVTVKIEYSENGQIFEEEFHCTHVVTQFPPVSDGWGTMYFTAWSLDNLCCFRAEKEKFEALHETFLKIRSSFKVNPQWTALSKQISQMLLQSSQQIIDQNIQAGWEMLRINGEASRQFVANNEAYINRQEQRIRESYNGLPPSFDSNSSSSKDSEYGSHEAAIDLIYGRESIDNSENTANEKVEGYHDYIWKDEFGNVKTTNDPNFDPNVGSHINWTQARKKRVGD